MDELAAQYGFQYEIAKAGIDESVIRHEDARQLVLSLAHAKADAIRAALRQQGTDGHGLLVTCDQVAWLLLAACWQSAAATSGAVPVPILLVAAMPLHRRCVRQPGLAAYLLPSPSHHVQVVLHEGTILEKPADEAQVTCRVHAWPYGSH